MKRNSSGHAYFALQDLDDPHSDPLPSRRSRGKGFCIIIALALVISLALGLPFYSGPHHVLSSHWSSIFKPKDIRKALKDADIVPDIIDDFRPTFALSVIWQDSKHDQASLGNTLKPENLQNAPEVYLSQPPSLLNHNRLALKAAKSTPLNNIVLVVTDPDAPSHQDNKWSEVCHWIAAGVPTLNTSSTSLEAQRLKLAEPLTDIVEYKPPGPPPKTGKHRYVFIALIPENKTSEPLDLVAPQGRKTWGTGIPGAGIKGWAESMGLVPIAANFIYAKNKEQ